MELPDVIELVHSPDDLLLKLNIGSKMAAFNGHFDTEPVVPGVVQIQWVLAFSKMYIKELQTFGIENLEAIKFQNVIRPDQKLSLVLSFSKQKLRFTFTSATGKHSSGRIVIT